MRAQFPDAMLYWIMGGDQWDALPRWKHPELLARCVEFIVVSRVGNIPSRDNFTMHPITTEHPAAATEIRRVLAGGDAKDEWLHPDVAEYIRRHGLYAA